MAIERKIDLEFGDETIDIVDTTGNYDVDSNPTGYGAPNAARTDRERYVACRKKNVNDVDDGPWTVQLYGVQFTRDRDGWSEGVMFSVTKWDNATAFGAGSGDTDVSIVSYGGSLYKALGATTGDTPSTSPAKWGVIDPDQASGDDLLLIVNTGVIKTYKDRVTLYDADVYWSGKKSESTQNGYPSFPESERDRKRLEDIYRVIQQGLSADQLENSADGEWAVLRLRSMGAKKAS